MDDLHRDLAPISERAWAAIEAEARKVLEASMAARKVVDFEGPVGWDTSSVGLGRADSLPHGPVPDIEAKLRLAQPLVEIRAPFDLSRSELDAIGRGSGAPNLDPLITAAQQLALAEDTAVFQGWEQAGIRGIRTESPHTRVSLSSDYLGYPDAVTRAAEQLREAGVAGPYALALGPRCFSGLSKTAGEGGYPVIRHVERLLEGPPVWAPAIEGALLVSLRGGDFRLLVGRDPSIGYSTHDAESVTLYLEESFTFQLMSPEAAVSLVYDHAA